MVSFVDILVRWDLWEFIKNYLYSNLLGVLENENSSNLVQNRVKIMNILHYTIVSIYKFI